MPPDEGFFFCGTLSGKNTGKREERDDKKVLGGVEKWGSVRGDDKEENFEERYHEERIFTLVLKDIMGKIFNRSNPQFVRGVQWSFTAFSARYTGWANKIPPKKRAKKKNLN